LTFITYELYKNKNNMLSYIKDNIKNWGAFGVIALPILMLYWYKPIFVYNMHRPYDRLHMDVMDFGRLDVQISFLFDMIKTYLLNFSSIGGVINTILVWIGLYAFYTSKEDVLKEFIKIFGIGAIFATFCYFITEPLLKMHFVPTYMHGFYLWTTAIIVGLYGLSYIKENLALKYGFQKNIVVFGLLFLILFANASYGFVNYMNNDKWANVGKYPMPEVYISLQKYLLENTNVNDVILSTKELSFAINAISGRKVMVNRWAHYANPYIDLSQRDIDAAVILYGNDTKKRLELIKKYNISYLYWEYYWADTEFQFDKNGRLVGVYDPLMALDKPKYREQLEKYGIKYIPMNFWLDPASRNKDVRKFNILIVSPENYHNLTNPWNPDLNKYLIEVWNYTYDGKKIAALYKIKVE
jgi:hypothetical protein